MNWPEEVIAKACCADLYQAELARLILGDTLHSGGLTLTNRLGRLMGIQPGEWVAGSGIGGGQRYGNCPSVSLKGCGDRVRIRYRS